MLAFLRLMVGFALTLMSIIVLWAIYSVRQFLPVLGVVVLLALSYAIAIGMWLSFSYLLKHWHKVDVVQVDQFGGYAFRHGKQIALTPLNAIAPPRSMTVEALPAKLPRLAELIKDGSLIKQEMGMSLMFQGYRQDGSIRYGEWPGVIAISGMQNVGKTVTTVTLLVIGLLQGARISVCDTHFRKERSLSRKIEPLRNFLELANSPEEVRTKTEEFSNELQRRKGGSECFPYILVYDEFASLMRTDMSDDISRTVEEASQEGHGFNMHLMIIVHDFSNDGLGEARLRSFFNWIYCHRMGADQAKFIEAFKTPSMKKRIAALPKGHTIARDEVNECESLIMPMADYRDCLYAAKMLEERQAPPAMPEIPRFIPENEPFIRAENGSFTPDTEPLRIMGPSEKPDFRSYDLTTYQGRKKAIKHLKGERFLQGEIILAVYHETAGGGEGYKKAVAEYKRIMEELAQEAITA